MYIVKKEKDDKPVSLQQQKTKVMDNPQTEKSKAHIIVEIIEYVPIR